MRATAAEAPARPACAPATAAAARAATPGSRGASAVGARAHHRRAPSARRGRNPAYEGAGDGVPRAPDAVGARRAGPDSGPRARGPSDDWRRGHDIGWTGTDERPGQDGWRTRVRRCDSALSTWSPAVGGLTRPDTCRTTSKRMWHSVSHRGRSEASAAGGARRWQAVGGGVRPAVSLDGGSKGWSASAPRGLPPDAPVATGLPYHGLSSSRQPHGRHEAGALVRWRAFGCSSRRA